MAAQRVIVWAQIAENDFDAIEDYIAQDKPLAVIHSIDIIEATVQVLKFVPDAGQSGRELQIAAHHPDVLA